MTGGNWPSGRAWAQVSRQEDATGADYGLPSVIISTVLEVERFNIGFSYDINAGYLNRPTDGRGAYAILFSLRASGRTPGKGKLPKVLMPNQIKN